MAGKLPQLDCKPRAFFACNTNCAKCHPKRLLLLDSPAAIRSLNYLSWPAEDCLSAAHGLPRKPFATRLQRLSADEEAHEWSVALCCLPEQSPGATGGTEMLSLLPSTPKAKPRLQDFRLLQSSRLKVRRESKYQYFHHDIFCTSCTVRPTACQIISLPSLIPRIKIAL